MDIRAVILGSALVLSCSGLAQAQPQIRPPSQQPPAQSAPAGGLLYGTNADLTLRTLQGTEFSNLEIVTIEGQKHVRGQSNGINVGFLHENCKDNSCARVTIMAFLGKQDINVDWANSWNREKAFTRVYINKDGEVIMDMDVVFFGGVSPDHFKQSAAVFNAMLKALFEYRPS
jgi:hypothetical protein